MQTDLTYFPGCSLHGSSKLYHTTIIDVMGKYGVKLHEINDWSCCGASSAHKTDHRLAVALPARNLGLAQKDKRPVLAPCSSCYSRLVATNVSFQKDPDLQKSINADLENPYTEILPIKNILELIVEGMNSKDAPKIVKPLKGVKVVAYYGCLLSRIPGFTPPDDVENPVMMDKIMKRLGAEAIDWSFKTDCCGASSAVADKPVSLRLVKAILDGAVEAGANCVVASCPMCQMNLDMLQDECKPAIPLPVYFITELMGVALGLGGMEKELRRHFVESVALLKGLGLL